MQLYNFTKGVISKLVTNITEYERKKRAIQIATRDTDEIYDLLLNNDKLSVQFIL